MSNLTITEATLEDMDFFLSHAREEEWNPGIYDAIPFYETDPHGFFVGRLGEEKIGCISAVAYNNIFGFIGFYIVIHSYRNRGYGHQLWAHAMNYLGSRSIGLDGVLLQQKNYEQSDFKLYYNNRRFEHVSGSSHHSTELIELKDVPFDVLLQYDTPIFGMDRARFLKKWIKMPESYSLGKIKNGTLTGYGVLRPCYNGFKIGPLFADHVDIALEIFNSLCIRAGASSVFLDVPEVNLEASKMIQELNLKSSFETVRMYRKIPPNQILDKVFGITTFELG